MFCRSFHSGDWLCASACGQPLSVISRKCSSSCMARALGLSNMVTLRSSLCCADCAEGLKPSSRRLCQHNDALLTLPTPNPYGFIIAAPPTEERRAAGLTDAVAAVAATAVRAW